MVDIRQSTNYGKYLASEGWIVERIDNINYFIRKFPLIGSVLKVQRPEHINYQYIDALVVKHRVFQIIIEPKNESQTINLASNGFKLSKSPYLPTKTLQIDLTQSEAAILSHFKKDARQAIKKSFDSQGSLRTNREVKNTIHLYSSLNDIRKWRAAWKDSVNYSRYVPTVNQLINLRKSFPCLAGRQAQNKSLFLASHNIVGRIIGGVLFTTSSHDESNYITYYWYGFTNKEGRTSLSQYSLLYYGLLWAKKQGYKVFDFEGIYDERFPNKSWLGFTHFKRSFGGTEVLYPGCYTKFRFPLWR